MDQHALRIAKVARAALVVGVFLAPIVLLTGKLIVDPSAQSTPVWQVIATIAICEIGAGVVVLVVMAPDWIKEGYKALRELMNND